ncbi:MAG: ribose 5-phosphate isomerase B [Halanaerobium sp.]|nr:ribose 5-phosphate isomerase B [Halanaerobium sp.]
MKIAIGSDHGGYNLKEQIKVLLDELGHHYRDFGTDSKESVDYPDYARQVGRAVASKECDKGILICGTGIGMSIAANKVKGIRAALCHDLFSARVTREHNDSNVLTMGERIIGSGLAKDIVRTWLGGEFETGGRHERRVKKVKEMEEEFACE